MAGTGEVVKSRWSRVINSSAYLVVGLYTFMCKSYL